MLHVSALSDRSGRYYLDDLAAELGPAATPAAAVLAAGRPGRWTGEGAAGLGLAGPVGPGELAAVLAGRSPATGRSLTARRGAVSGYDLTFTPPKSVSALWGLSPPEVAAEVLSAHEAAVEAAAGYLARRAVAVRRGAGDDRRLEPAGGVVGASFTHGVSRALDPHLHSHVVVANMGQGPDGRWTAVDGRGLFAHARAAGRLYDAELRHRLSSRLGVAWAATAAGALEVDGFDPAVLGALSSRGAEVRAALAQSGHTSRRAGRVAWAATRDEKGPAPDPAGLAARWTRRAAAVGWVPRDLSAVVGRAVPGPPTVDERRFADRLAAPLRPAVTRRDAVGAWAEALTGGAPAADVEGCVDRLAGWGEAVGVGEPGRAPAAVVAPGHLVAALGPRPGTPALLGVWLEGASAVARYRAAWGVTDRAEPLGVDGSPGALARLPARRLADHLEASRRLDDARRELGRARGRGAEPAHLSLGRA